MENELLIYADLLFDNFDELLEFPKEETQVLQPDEAPPTLSTWRDVPSNFQYSALPCAMTGNDDATTGLTTTANGVGSSACGDDDAFLCDDLDIAEMEWLSNFVEESFSPTSIDGSKTTVNASNITDSDSAKGNDNSSNQVSLTSNEEELLYLTHMHSPLSVLEDNGILANSGTSSTYSSTSSSSPTTSSCSGVISELKAAGPLSPTEHGRAQRTKRIRPVAFPHSTEPILPSLDANGDATMFEHGRFSESSSAPAEVDPIPGDHKKKNKKLKIKLSPPPQTTTIITNTEGDARRCLHCGIQKTPQWRAGPMGPKTLCNACGVRYKSGRLFPEYRPAASPSFVVSVHSNSHKKVVEMRMKSIQNQEGSVTIHRAAKQVSSKCCELLNYVKGTKEWGAQEGRKIRGLPV